MILRDERVEDDAEEEEEEEEENEQDEEYDENADDDFNPDKPDGDDSEQSSSPEDEVDTSEPAKKLKKRKSNAVENDLDSGDEATIKERTRKKRKPDAAKEEDSGGEGGFIRTRAQRVAENEARKHRKRARDGEVTVNVEELWAELSSVPLGRASAIAANALGDAMDVESTETKENAPPSSDEMIRITQRIVYAGTVEEIEKVVPRSSKEAQAWLAEHPEGDSLAKKSTVDSSGLQRPLKRPSMFEPNPSGLVKGVTSDKLRQRAPSRLDVVMALKREEAKKKAQKLSTVDKSKADWDGYVDKEGFKDELDEYGRSKSSFLGRESFLDRVQGAREARARDARMRL